MADDVSTPYSSQNGPAAAGAPGPLLAFSGCERVDLGNGAALLLNRDNGKQMTVSAEVATALTYCSTFKTLHEHAATLANTIPQLQGQLEDVKKVLVTVQDAGLLLDAQAICERLTPAELPPAKLAPTRICIITCDRPAAVGRLLDSMLRTGGLTRHDELFLVDDSRDATNQDHNRELALRFNLTSAKNMHYVGAAAQEQLLQQLIAARPADEAAIRFLIDRQRWADKKSFGLARTLCLLLTVGYRCIVLDDDVLCSTVLPPAAAREKADGISFGGGANRELACFGSEQELMQSASHASFDPLSGHADCLGMPLAQAIAQLEVGSLDQEKLQDANAAMLNTLQAESPILVTQCGSWGDPGTPGSGWFFQLGAESVQRLLAAPGGLEGAQQNRHYWLGRCQPNVSKMAVMSQATGLDNSRLLPPYFPVFRGEDYLFASMLLYLHPDSAVLDYAWCIPHLPVEQRDHNSADQPIAARGDLALCGRYLADQVDAASGVTPATRLQKLAVMLRELSEHSPGDLLAVFRTEIARENADMLHKLGSQLQQPPATGSQAWQDYLQRGAQEVANALQSPADPAAIPDAPQGLAEEVLMQNAKTVLAEFSAAIGAWPAIRDSAASITAQMLAAGELAP